jgi:hypothetical protein
MGNEATIPPPKGKNQGEPITPADSWIRHFRWSLNSSYHGKKKNHGLVEEFFTDWLVFTSPIQASGKKVLTVSCVSGLVAERGPHGTLGSLKILHFGIAQKEEKIYRIQSPDLQNKCKDSNMTKVYATPPVSLRPRFPEIGDNHFTHQHYPLVN